MLFILAWNCIRNEAFPLEKPFRGDHIPIFVIIILLLIFIENELSFQLPSQIKLVDLILSSIHWIVKQILIALQWLEVFARFAEYLVIPKLLVAVPAEPRLVLVYDILELDLVVKHELHRVLHDPEQLVIGALLEHE